MYDAVILAGGMGKRLYPITKGCPKPLVNVGTKPVLYHILKTLEGAGTKNCAITLMYEGEQIKNRFRSRFGNMHLEYFTEDEPLGTAGGVKAAAGALSTDSFIVLSGDGVFDFDISRLVDFHEKSCAELTVGTYFHSDPTEYGTVISDKDGKVLAFAEKASWSSTVTGNVNTGIYAIKKSVLELIPDGTAWDFAKDLFPLLLKEKRALFSTVLHGYWCDIGNTAALLKCNRDALSGRIRGDFTGSELGGEGKSENSIAGRGCTLKKDALLKDSVIGDGCVIGEGARVSGSLLMDGVSVPAGVTVKDCVIARNTELPEKKSFIGKAVSCDGTVRSIGSDELCFKFTDKGITPVGEPSETSYALLGAAISKACAMGKVGILCDGNEQSVIASRQIINAAALAGAKCAYDFGVGFEAQSAFAAYSYALSASVFVKSTREGVFVKIYDSSTSIVCRDFERELASALRGTPSVEMGGEAVRTHGLSPRYTDALIKSVYSTNMGVFSLDGLVFALSPRPSLGCLRAALSLLDGQIYTPEKAGLYFDKSGVDYMDVDISDDGFDLKIRYKGKSYRKELICAILAKDAASRGEKELPVSFEREPELLWADGEISVESFPSSPHDAREALARYNARRSLWLTDASFMLMRLASVIKNRNRDLLSLSGDVGDICKIETVVPCKSGRVYTMERLIKSGGRYGKEGIVFVGEKSRASVTCNRDESLRIIAYATGTEAANALSLDIKNKINEIL